MNGTSMRKLVAFCVLILMISSVSNAVEITIVPKHAIVISAVSAIGVLVAHAVSKDHYDKDDECETTDYLLDDEDKKKIQLSQWFGKIRNVLALISAAAGGFALREYIGSTVTFKLG